MRLAGFFVALIAISILGGEAQARVPDRLAREDAWTSTHVGRGPATQARPRINKGTRALSDVVPPQDLLADKNGAFIGLVCAANPIPGDPLGWTGATWYSDANYPANAACGRPFLGEQASAHSAAAVIDTSGPSGYEALPAAMIVHDSHGADGLAMYGYNDINYTSSTIYYVDFFLKCGRAGPQFVAALYNYYGWGTARTVTCTGDWQYVSASRGTGGFSGNWTHVAFRPRNAVNGDTFEVKWVRLFKNLPGGVFPPRPAFPPVPAWQTIGCGDSIHAIDPTLCAGDPVDTLTSSFVDRADDLALPGVGIGFDFFRRYASNVTAAGRLGPGWRDSYSASLTVGPNVVTLNSEDGEQLQYFKKPDGSYWAGAGVRSQLTQLAGGYELLRHDQAKYSFNSSGRLLSLVDRNGKGLTFNYDANGRLNQIQDASGRLITFTYNASNLISRVATPDGRHADFAYTSGRLTSVTDVRGKVWTYAYDAGGRLASLLDPNSSYRYRNTYDSSTGRLTSQQDALGKITTHAWDKTTQTATITDARGKVWKDVYSNNALVKRIDPLTNATAYEYDSDLNLSRLTDARGNATVMSYDARGNLLSRTAPTPLSYQESWAYNTRNDPLSSTDGRGNATSYGYDAAGNLTSVSEPGGIVTGFGRDPANGLLASVTDPRGKTTTFAHDANGNLNSLTTPLGKQTTIAYDTAGRPTSLVDPRGHEPGANPADYTWTSSYDTAGNELSETDPLGNTTSFTYDNAGRLTRNTDAAGHATNYGYDAANRLTTVTAPDTSVTSYAYDDVGNLTTRTDALTHPTTYAYDDANRLTTATNPLAKSWSYSYDPAGNLTRIIDAANATTSYGYDALNRLTAIDYSDTTPDVTYGYDGNDNRTSMTDGAGNQTYVYDALDQLTQTSRGTDTFSYGYDGVGNVTRRTYPDGRVIDYSYDDDDRMAAVTSLAQATTYLHDAAGNLTQTTLPSGNGYTETRTYDRAARMTEIRNAKAGTTLSFAQYVYDPVGNPTSTTTISGTTAYGYDLLDRLTSASGGGLDLSYVYDAVGNRASETRPTGTTTYTYNAGDQLTATSGPNGTVPFSHDADGNQTQAGPRAFAYDLANRLTSTTEGESTTTYVYDGDGIRLQAAGGQTTNYLWDVNNDLPQLALERDGAGAMLRNYLYGTGPVSMDTGGSTSYFQRDGIGSITNVTSASGAPQWTYDYEPYGTARTATQNDPNAPANVIRFAGELLDGTSLYHLRARQYDPLTGRFLRTDPLPSSRINPSGSSYAYVDDRPTVLVDPSGMGAVWAASCGGSGLSKAASTAAGIAAKTGAGAAAGTKIASISARTRSGLTLPGVERVTSLGAGALGGISAGAGQAVSDAFSGCDYSVSQRIGRVGLSTVAGIVSGAAGTGVGVACLASTLGVGSVGCAAAGFGTAVVVNIGLRVGLSPVSRRLGWGALG
jgi:RHS repeat-associated protein